MDNIFNEKKTEWLSVEVQSAFVNLAKYRVGELEMEWVRYS